MQTVYIYDKDNPWHYLTSWDGQESEDQYVDRVAQEHRTKAFWSDARNRAWGVSGTALEHNFVPTEEDKLFARRCWEAVQKAVK